MADEPEPDSQNQSLEALTLKYRALKGHLTRSVDRFDRVITRDDVDSIKNAYEDVQTKVKKITIILDEMTITDHNSEATVTSQHTALMEICDEVDIKFQNKITSKPIQEQGREPTSHDNELTNLIKALTEKIEIGSTRHPIKLPGIPPPRWDGTPRNFHSWTIRIQQYFESCQVKDDREKLMILLNGESLPANIRDHISDCLSCDGENGVWQRLKEKIPESAVVRDVLLALQDIKPMKTTAVYEMRQVLDGITDFSRRMKELGKETDLKTSMMFEIISSKIESNLFYDYMRQRNNDEEKSVPTLLKFLRQETEARELREKPHSLSTASNFCHNLEYKESHQVSSTSHQPPTNSYRPRNPDQCPFCPTMDPHLIIKCPVFTSSTAEERRQMIKEAKRCFLCLKFGHVAGRCRRPDKAVCSTCKLFHHRMVACPPYLENNGTNPTVKDQAGVANSTSTFNATSGKHRFSPTSYIEIRDKDGRWRRVVAFFDSGADTTLIRTATAELLGLQGDPYTFTYGVAGGGTVSEQSSRYKIEIKSLESSQSYQLTASSVQKPAHDSPSLDDDIFERYPHLTVARHCTPNEGAEIDLLIGYDYHSLTIPQEVKYSTSDPTNHPAAARSLLGWTIFGHSLPKPIPDLTSRVSFLRHMDDIQLLYMSDVVGVKPTSLCTCTDNEIAESQFIKHCKRKLRLNDDGRMEIEMPWRDGFPEILKCNRIQAEACMIRQEIGLTKRGKLTEYDDEIQKLIDNGFVRELDIDEDKNRGWYLPHHAVYQAHKTTKVRIVWNSAAKYNGLCLNDGFLKGPDLLNSLVKCLLHFRKKNVAVVGDVKKMFNQICLSAKDQIYHRFVWRLRGSTTIRYFQWLRLPFGDKPAPDISMMAVRLLAEDLRLTDPEGYVTVTNCMYMDDITDSFESPTTAQITIDQVNHILSNGSFTIKEWHSNHSDVDQCQQENQTRVLGHLWDKQNDSVEIQLDPICKDLNTLTKRKAASLVAKLWDPLGLLSPVSIRYKIGLQEIWESGLGWDDKLNDDQTRKWNEYIHEINQLVGFKIPRKLRPHNAVGPPQLHGFSDASEMAVGAVIWLRWPTTNGIHLSFVIAKSLVAPLKKRSIPRLELTATVVLSRLIEMVSKVIGDSELMRLWTDSEVVLSWVRSPARTFKPFVSARIQEIQETIPSYMQNFHYIPSSLNPADALTKPINPEELSKWSQGPAFLYETVEKWPSQEPKYDDTNKRVLLKEYTREALIRVNQLSADPEESICFENHLIVNTTDWFKLTSLVARCRRVLQRKEKVDNSTFPTVNELEDAKLSLFFLSQKVWNKRQLDSWKIRKLNPKLDKGGIIRVEGRLRNLDIPECQKQPILLQRGSPIVEIYGKYIHNVINHQGYRVAIASAFKEGVFIYGGSRLFKDVASKCVFCRTRRRNLLTQQMGELPSFRGQPYVPPFQNVAMDYFGPVDIKLTRNTTIEGSILIVTCTTTRAVSMELVESLTTESFLCAFRRFTCNRGIYPRTVFSDQGRTFTGAQSQLKKWIDDWNLSKIKAELLKSKTEFEWKFNTPLASHMNGVVESLIRSCRKGLDALVNYHHRKFRALEWQTILAEVAYLINSRPLFPEGPDVLESPPITANDIIHPHGRSTVLQPDLNDVINPRNLIEVAHRRVQAFWDAWMLHMPPQLIQRSKWYHPRSNLKVGDLVLLMEPGLKGKSAPRGLWKRGLVQEVLPGKDGLVRKAIIKTATSDETKGITLKERPIHKMCLIATGEELQHGLNTET